MKSRIWKISGNPRGRSITLDDFLLDEEKMRPLNNGEFRVRVEYLSFDPSQKGWMENVGYAEATAQGDVMPARGIGEVVESKCEAIKVGTKVSAMVGWREFAVCTQSEVDVLEDQDRLTLYLGPLGSTGMAAYFGFLQVGKPIPGDRVLVSGAAGAVGSVVGQIAKIAGCKVIGTAGGSEKCDMLLAYGFDEAIDYKSDDIKARIRTFARGGLNVVFDNVGGEVLNTALGRIAIGARVVICGGISRYSSELPPPGPSNYMNLVFRRATMAGFLTSDFQSEFALAQERIATWIEEGRISYDEDIQQGFANIPATLMRVFEGKNHGKQLLRLETA